MTAFFLFIGVCICYCYSFYGFIMVCRFMEWNVTFGLDAAELYGTEPAKVTVSSLLNTDWSTWWAESFGTFESSLDVIIGIANVILYLVAIAIILGLIFLAYYMPYRTFLSINPKNIQNRMPKTAKLIAVILSLVSHPVMWYLGLHYGETIINIFSIILLIWVVLVICYYVLMFCLNMWVAPLAGAASAVAKAATAANRESSEEFDFSDIPFIVYDDSGHQWKRRGIFGDHAVYYNANGDEVTIYSAQVSTNSASTSAGTLHWY